MLDYTEKNTSYLPESCSSMSATSNKSRILLLMMVAIALVFFISSFLAATFSSAPAGTTSQAQQELSGSNCIVVRTAEDRLYGACMFS